LHRRTRTLPLDELRQQLRLPGVRLCGHQLAQGETEVVT
jgi:hypothetical protein